MNNWILKKIIEVFVPLLTPTLVNLMRDALKSWYKHALTTNNPIDDVFVKLLCECFVVDISDVNPTVVSTS